MNATLRLENWSLRRRLIAACLAVELLAVLAIVIASAQLLQRQLSAQSKEQVSEIKGLLGQAIVSSLAQRDYASVQQLLEGVREGRHVAYLALWDHRDQLVATAGWPAERTLPPRDEEVIDLDRADDTLHLATAIDLAGQRLGRLDIGLSTERLRAARTDFLRRSAAIAALALVLSAVLLAAIAMAITRGLARLSNASRRVAEGDYAVELPLTGGAEISSLAYSFNRMAATVKERVAALERSEAAQREERARLSTMLGAMRIGIALIDAANRVAYANEAFVKLWKLSETPLGSPTEILVATLARQTHAEDMHRVFSLAGMNAAVADADLHLLDGRLVVQRVQALNEGRDGWIWMHQDVTLDRQTQLRASQALLDPLTRLLNRRGLTEALQGALHRAAHEGGTVALLFIDLDDFKLANDLGGHRAGDEILVSVSRALAAQLRRDETVARVGGDEFAVLCPGISGPEAAAIAERLVEGVAALCFDVGGQALRVSCSVGIALFPADAGNDQELMARADKAMYQAKRAGKGRWAAYRAGGPDG